MSTIRRTWKEIAIAFIIVLLNLVLFTQTTLAYHAFKWLNYVAAYEPQLLKLFLPIIKK